MKRVAFCINNLKVGGAEKLLIDLINNWPNNYVLYLLLLEERNDLINLIDSSRLVKIIYVTKNKNVYRKVSFIRNFFIKEGINICFSHLEKSNKICLLSSFLTKTRVIPVVHSINIYNSSNWSVKFISKLIYKFYAKMVVAISEPVMSYCINGLGINKSRLVKIDNGIDFKRVKKYKRDVSFGRGINFAVLGRMEFVKGYDYLLDVLGIKVFKGFNWSLRFIGDGKEFHNLLEKSNKLSISEKIQFLGYKENPFDYLTDVHYLLMPSRREGLPISLLESLSFGIPVIVSDVGILPKIVKDGYNGFVFKVEDEKMLGDTLLKCLRISTVKYEELSINAGISVLEYSIENCISKYIELVNS